MAIDIVTFIPSFRESFPEFSDEAKYTDGSITFWANTGDLLLNEARWGPLLMTGLMLFVAHQVTLASMDLSSADKGSYPGMSSGVITNKGVGDVSVGYNTNAYLMENAGNFNITKYGREFWRLVNIIGMGGTQV